MDVDDLIPLIDRHYSEFWLGVDVKLAPYLRAVRRSIVTAPSDFLQVASFSRGVPSPSAATNDMFVPIHVNRVTWRVVKRHGLLEREPQFQEKKIQHLLECRERRVLLLGSAGTGKTTCLRRLAYVAANEALSTDAPTTIPVLLKARDVATNSCSLLEQCDAETRRVTSVDKPTFSAKDLDAGRVLVMIDALDEVASPDKREEVASLAVEFSERYAQCRIIITSRPLSSISSIPAIQNFEEFRISPIDQKAAELMVARLHHTGQLSRKHSGEILRRLQNVHGMELTPLLVTVFVSTTEHERRDVPANITELFKKYTEMMLGRWDVTKGMGLQYQANLKDFVIRQIAFAMHQHRETQIELQDLRMRIGEELTARGHEASVDVLTEEIVNRSGLFRQNGDLVEFRHHLLQEFFAGRGIRSRSFLESVICDDWWRRSIVFYFGENPSDGHALEAARVSVAERPTPERCTAALTVGLGLQACYLVEVELRIQALAWTVTTLARSQDEFLDFHVKAGRGPLFSLLGYYLLGRDSVGAQILGLHHDEVGRMATDTDDPGEANVAEFWVIVGLIEAGFLNEAEARIARFATEDQRLRYMLFLGCFMLRKLRTTAREDRKTADRIMATLKPHIHGLRKELLREYSSELLELRGHDVVQVDSEPHGQQLSEDEGEGSTDGSTRAGAQED